MTKAESKKGINPLLAILIIITIIYLAIAFICVELDFRKWSEVARVEFVFISVSVSVLYFMAKHDKIY